MLIYRDFDFENSGWKAYRSNLEFPPGKEDQGLLRWKAKWYKREIDPTFDISSATSTAPGSGHAAPGSGHAEATTQEHTGTDHTSSAEHSASQPDSQAGTGSHRSSKKSTSSVFSKLQPRPQEALFVMHLALVLLAMLHLQPLSRWWSQRGWLYFLQISALCSFYKVYLKHGMPRVRPFPAALKQWAQPVTSSHDFQYAMLSLLFLGSRPIALVLMPPTVLALYHVSAYVSKMDSITSSRLWQRYGARGHAWLAAHQRQALLYNACAEIGTGFVSVLSLLAPPRNFLLPFFMANFLRMRYWSPESASYHRQAWSMVDQRAGFILHHVPLLQKPVGWVQNWFQSVPGR